MLAIKLYCPAPRPGVVIRQPLLVRLNQGLARKLTLVAAPAGYGKTTLISTWVAAVDRPAAWLSLTPDDSDPIRFLAYVVAALQTIRPDLGGGVLALLQSPQPPPIEPVLTHLLNAIASTPDPLMLVLDDYHSIASDQVDQVLAFLIAHLPPQLHLVIASRADPALPLAQLRARDQLTELRLADLCFTSAEASAFFVAAMGLQLAEPEVAMLVARTEGWVAGLQLAGLSLQGQHDPTSFIRSFAGSHRFVIDYLVAEALERQPVPLQRFLLQSSILDRLCGPLCDALMDDPTTPGQATLEALERANLFLIPLDHERRWYRYHHLFGEVLRQRLHQRDAQQIEQLPSSAELHRRASDWFEGQNLIPDAVQHAIAAGAVERAAGLAERAWSDTFRNSFQNTDFLDWMRALPNELIRARPVLSVGYAWALLDIGALEAAEPYLHDAEWWLNAGPDERLAQRMTVADEALARALPVTIALARATYASATDDLHAALHHAQWALTLLPEHDHFGRAGAYALLGVAALRSGELEAAATAFAEGIALMRAVGNLFFALSGIPPLADIRLAQGRLREAQALYEHALRLTSEPGGVPLEGTADLYLGLSELCLLQGDLVAAHSHLRRGEELGAQAGLPAWPARLRRVQASLAAVEGKLEHALALLDAAQQYSYRGPLPDLQPTAALKAQIWIRQGRLAEAWHWARESGLEPDDELTYGCEFEHLTLARLLIAQARHDQDAGALHDATALLERLLAAAEAGGRMGNAITMLVLQAIAAAVGGNHLAAHAPLERALVLAEREGYVRSFVDEGPQLVPLLEAQSTAHRSFCDGLVAAIRHAASPTPGARGVGLHTALERGDELSEPLSPRELEVLRLVAQGLSNRAIGERLHLALSTVKGHNLTIFAKLQVQRRTAAVARARKLGLL